MAVHLEHQGRLDSIQPVFLGIVQVDYVVLTEV
jgi:hypothetical protein